MTDEMNMSKISKYNIRNTSNLYVIKIKLALHQCRVHLCSKYKRIVYF